MKRACLLLLPGLLAATLLAEDPETKRVEAAVSVVATRLEAAAADTTVRVVTRKEIEALPARSLAELLQTLPGVDVRRRGVDGIQTDVGIRGADFNGTLVLVDGEPVNDPQTNHFSMDLDVPLDAVERVEVMPGAAGSALYGSGAIGGVVNIVTRGAALGRARGEGEGRFAHGTHSLDAGSLRIAAKANDTFTFAADWARSEWAGFRDDTEAASESVRFATRASIPAGDIDLTLGYAGREYGAYAFYGTRFPNQQETTRTRTARLSANLRLGGWTLAPSASLRAHWDDFVLDRERPSFYENKHDTDSSALRLVARHALGAGSIALGAEAGREAIRSTNLGLHRRDHGAAFVEASHPFFAGDADRGGARLGLRVDAYEGFGSRVSPFVGLTFRPVEPLRLRASLGTAFRVPTFLDLYYSDPQTLGNADLRPEKATSWEAGASWDAGPLMLDAAFFHRRGTDLIDYVRSSPDEKFTAKNIRRADASGIEGTLELRRLPSFLTRAAVQATYVFTDLAALTREADGATEGRYVLDPLHVKWDVIAAGRLSRVSAWMRVGYLSRPSFDEGVWLADARIAVDLLEGDIFEVYGEGQNLGDKRYEERPGVPLPGRILAAGMRLTW